MKKVLFFISLGFVVCFLAFAEQITITTYYPAPYGVYRELESRRSVVGNDNMPTVDGVINFQELAADPAFRDAGALYYNNAANEFRYYDGTAWTPITSNCIRMNFTAATGFVQCPAGHAIPMAPFKPTATSGNYLCCPF